MAAIFCTMPFNDPMWRFISCTTMFFSSCSLPTSMTWSKIILMVWRSVGPGMNRETWRHKPSEQDSVINTKHKSDAVCVLTRSIDLPWPCKIVHFEELISGREAHTPLCSELLHSQGQCIYFLCNFPAHTVTSFVGIWKYWISSLVFSDINKYKLHLYSLNSVNKAGHRPADY